MLILASASPRRRELLTQAGFKFVVEAANVDESLLPEEPAGAYVQRLAEEKAQAIFARHVQASSASDPLVVLGADTSVVYAGEILGKPASADGAERILHLLSGRTHEVMTGVAVVTQAGVASAVDTTLVTFCRIPDEEIARYCATAEPFDKAGAYGIQGYAARWIPRIEGCYFNVMGLPIARVVDMLEAAGRVV